MFEHKILQKLNEYFLELNQRSGKSVFFYRINGYSEEIKVFLQKYYDSARRTGVVLEEKIPNPDENNLSYYYEIMGEAFQLSMGFLTSSLKKWLPRMNDYQRNSVAAAIYDTLNLMQKNGKNDNMLKNAYIKFMCWLYYKFERIVSQLGQNQVPKILYQGDISRYELKLITILSNAGCDVVLLQYHGDQGYLSLDKESKLSIAYPMAGLKTFPETFSIKWIRMELENQMKVNRLYGTPPRMKNCTNAWIEGNGLEDILKEVLLRGNDPNLFYNCFIRINGAEDKLTYLNELYQFYLQYKNTKRKIVIMNHELKKPTIDEIGQIKRNSYSNFDQMITQLSANISYTANNELEKIIKKAFIDSVVQENKEEGMNLNRVTNKAVYMLCWLNRYLPQLFSNWKAPEISCFIYLGGCKDENESMFLKLLSKLPVDVLILKPDLNTKCCLEDEFIYDIHYEYSLEVKNFPCENSEIRIGTAAYHAERELDTLMYQDSGMYREHQCSDATAILLKTMYEEIFILWDQELKYRPNFSVVNGVVNIPAIFAKISGVKNGLVADYWSDIKKMITEDTFVIRKAPFIQSTDANPVKPHVTEFLKNGKIQKNKIKSHKTYSYAFLREEIQDYLLDKLELLLNQKSIKGTFENGTEYTIISVVLNLKKDIIRLIQKFDFTKKNPKLIYINTTETMISLEDSIMMNFLSLVGFDIVCFIPTGYQTVENHFSNKIMEEHQIGEYIYDLVPPDFDRISSNKRQPWHQRIFMRRS
jgi:hypothetical protein